MKFRAVMIAVIVGALASAAEGQCLGDCDGNGEVAVTELIVMVNIALGTVPCCTVCAAADPENTGEVLVTQIVSAVNNALQGCPDEPTPTPTLTEEPPTPTPTLMEEPTLTPTEELPTPTPSPTATTTTFSSLDFVAGQPAGTCGASRDAGGATLKVLNCGFTYAGGGGSSAPPLVSAPVKARFAVTGCTGSICALGPSSGPQPAPLDCTDTGCPIGPPMQAFDPLPTCTATVWGAPAEGSVDVSNGTVSFIQHSNAHTWLTINRTHPCPRCIGGTCEAGARKGLACTSTDPDGLTDDCLPGGTDGSVDIGFLNLSVGLTTDARHLNASDGAFCPGQDAIRPGLPGCFGSRNCRTIDVSGVPVAGGLLPAGSSHAMTIAALDCVPATGNTLVDSTSDLPGPASQSFPGTVTLNP